jgi:acid phosphatase
VDEAIAPTLQLFKTAREKGVSVFFITGRSETVRSATEANLRKAGYDGWSGVIMRPAGTTTPSAADYKAPERAKIARQGFTIIANVGDQPSDLAGGYAERTFLVPNPFYRVP